MTTLLHTTLTNEDKGWQFSDWTEDLADTYMGEDASMGEIYRAAQSEYGRCTGKVYVDTPTGPKAVGWFFVSRQQYEDTHESYLRGAWVTVSHKEES